MAKRLLCISYRFPPERYPLATRVEYILNNLESWEIDAITAAQDAQIDDHVTVHRVPPRAPDRFFSFLRRLRLGKLLDWFVWPDAFVFWLLPAYRRARQLLRRKDYDAILVFMMPYSQGLVGVLLKRQTGLPLILNFDDSLTCSDMNPSYPSRLHYGLAQKLEDLYVQTADASIYVSRRNMERVRERQPLQHRSTFHLVRWGAESLPASQASPARRDTVRIVYTGGTGGWYRFLEEDRSPSLLKRTYRAWQEAGRYEVAALDHRTHGPIYLGQAVQQVLDRHPEWKGRIKIDIYGPKYPDAVVNAVLDKYDLYEIVNLHGRVPHEEALRKMTESDLLFMALPDRVDGSPGSRISAKTYEYLMTDRPILAALPPGENREYLQDKPGVHFTPPDGVDEMSDVVTEVAAAKFGGDSIAVDRSDLRPSLSSTARADAFEEVLTGMLAGTQDVADAAGAHSA